MKEPLFKDSHPFVKIVFVSAIGFTGLIMLGGLMLILNNESVYSLKIMTALQGIFLFILPAVLGAFLFSKDSGSYLYLNKTKGILILLTILIIYFSLPIINFTGYLNSKMSLPEGLSGLENILKNLEETAKVTTEKFLNVESIGGLFVNLIIIAVFPAVAEELVFRGILMRLVNDWVKNMHIAVFITAFLFSFIHFQFYGFLPRMLLGILFGYLLYCSGSILLPMLAHFLNNATAVLLYYFYKGSEVYEKAETLGSGKSDIVWLLVSAGLLIIFFMIFKKEAKEQGTRIN